MPSLSLVSSKVRAYFSGLNGRSLTALLMGIGLLVMGVSGLVLYFAPGPFHIVFLWLKKGEWERVHTIFGLVFIVAGLFHATFNWASLTRYFQEKAAVAQQVLPKIKREATVALVLAVFVFVASVANWQPVPALLQLRGIFLPSMDGRMGPPGMGPDDGISRRGPDLMPPLPMPPPQPPVSAPVVPGANGAAAPAAQGPVLSGGMPLPPPPPSVALPAPELEAPVGATAVKPATGQKKK